MWPSLKLIRIIYLSQLIRQPLSHIEMSVYTKQEEGHILQSVPTWINITCRFITKNYSLLRSSLNGRSSINSRTNCTQNAKFMLKIMWIVEFVQIAHVNYQWSIKLIFSTYVVLSGKKWDVRFGLPIRAPYGTEKINYWWITT